MKRTVASLLLVATLSLSLGGCGSSDGVNQMSSVNKGENELFYSSDAEDNRIISGIVESFMTFTKIPRQSGYEEKISEYLYSWADERGYDVERDEVNNVIFDVPGTDGMEDAPLTILQGHMDMVVAVEEGNTFDSLTDEITVINDGITLRADGTSLGADNGIGMAAILNIIDNSKAHGPLRIIFTTYEETGGIGAAALTSDTIEDAKYMINFDSEKSGNIDNGSAANAGISGEWQPESVVPENKNSMEISISGLLGGHSGIDINKGRLNAIIAIGSLLNTLANNNIDFELAGIEGGEAENAIPKDATAYIVIEPENETAVKELIGQFTQDLKKNYGNIESNLKVETGSHEMPKAVLTSEAKSNVLKLINNIQNGVISMSQLVDGLVESSSNLGVISVTAGGIGNSSIIISVRSMDDDKLDYLIDSHKELANEIGIKTEVSIKAYSWPIDTDNKLLDMFKAAYNDQTGEEISVNQVHAGLETGAFARLGPDMDIVALGFDITDTHSVNETCYLNTIPVTYRLVERVLSDIGQEGV